MTCCLCSPSSFEKSALAQGVVKAFPTLEDPDGVTGFVSSLLY